MPAPIVVFAYNRPDHLQRTLTALGQNTLADQSDVFIYCDGAKTPQQQSAVDATRAVADAAEGFANVTVVKRDVNWGLAKNIVDGVTKIVQDYGRIIVVEDDILTSPHFLTYMNDALSLYDGNPKVACISGWCFAHDVPNPPETFLLKGADCLGWGTWTEKWEIYNHNAIYLLDEITKRGLLREFNVNNCYDYALMLQDAAAGRVSSWAIRWYASAFLADMYCLYPKHNLTENIGFDNTGTHCVNAENLEGTRVDQPINVKPIPVECSPVMYEPFTHWQNRMSGGHWRRLLRHHFPWLRSLKKRLFS